MPVTTDIVRTYRGPGRVLRGLLDMGKREDRALIFLMGACLLIFISQWPFLAREAHLDPSVPLEARVGAALVAWLFAMPIVFYCLAGLSHLIAKFFGGKGSYFSGRMALFWTLLAVSPLMLFRGMVAGLIGPGAQLTAADTLVTIAFFVIWGLCLREAERG